MKEKEQTFLFDEESREKDRAKDFEENTSPVSGTHPKPLAVRMRPRKLDEIIGQDHILGEGALLPRLLRADRLGSILLYGPPGCGKTTLAEVIALESRTRFIRINAVISNVAELRDTLRFARSRPEDRTILFIDEIHRFNKAQQDLLLPDVEEGNIRLIGATTHNPGFYLIAPLLSRSHLFRFEPISADHSFQVVKVALMDSDRGLGQRKCSAEDRVLRSLVDLCDGDLRRALNALENLVMSLPEGACLSEKEVLAFARERQIPYDTDEVYDTASAFIKSMRGGDPDASLYWLAKMLAGGEDPRFIARRITILASEDIGLADPHALPLAIAAFKACEYIGLPECELNLAHAVVYMATAPKSNSTTAAFRKAGKTIREKELQSVPLHLRDASTKISKSLGHGKEYQYSHDYPETISVQGYMERPEQYYFPKDSGAEVKIAARLKRWKEIKTAMGEEVKK
ncbi:MAG: Replication-associated recombination protein A [Candidatus Moanabacter tarae]|uniref:Replication-associated recombination protein A n=1 Tax=Candidatus Moanibacter tarae TaxID=2200854 RepID=A0A2Z4AS73_9BACT|nr:MAG: Replication-associated recombination protein A [Candidatus Moanabacter tarae]|tara:strand:- start:53764 stop:55137 length:1374 start_codon:yes stop_codon:yes gene_type:complete